jgi:hypothetical protein
MTRPIIAIFQPWMDAEQACKIRRMTMRFRRGTRCILPALLLLAMWALPASASEQLAPPQKTANVIPLPKKKPPRSHTIKIATLEPLSSSGWVVARYMPLILGVGF